jgi:hypothetical protein
MSGKTIVISVVLSLIAAGMFLAECALFHFPFETGLDVLLLVWMTFVPGVLIIVSLRQKSSFDLAAHEVLSLGCALGFGVVPIVLWLLNLVGIGHVKTNSAIINLISVSAASYFGQKKWKEFDKILPALNNTCIFAIGALLLFAAYNLQQFHYGEDGSIITHGLFGVDIPFLAGEVHGIRDFGTLRDLHQMGQPWQYHDWTYQLLALLPRDRTLPDLALAAPLVGYVMLALSIFTLSFRLTSSKLISYLTVALWFLVSGIEGGELSCYALSPSFVFGSMIFVNILLVFDLRMKASRKKDVSRTTTLVLSGMLTLLLLELSQTKLSSYLVMLGALLLLGFMGLTFTRGKKQVVTEIVLGCLLTLALVLWQSAGTNALMPSGDFLIGAPLLGYANHVASLLHVPVSTINPVSHGLALHWQSIFIIPFFLFHFLRFALLDPKILAALIMLAVFRGRLWKESHELMWVLALMIVIGFLLPVLYSPAWYPLALSFYAPLMSVQAAMFVSIIGLGLVVQKVPMSRSVKMTMGIVTVIVLAGFVLSVRSVRSVVREESAKPYIVSAAYIHAMNYLQAHASDTDVIATRRFDLDTTGDESYYWYSGLSGRRVISEGAKYGSLLGAVTDNDAVKGTHPVPATSQLLRVRRALLDTIYSSHDTASVRAAMAASHARFIIETTQPREQLSIDPSQIATRVFGEDGIEIWRLPQFTQKLELLE